MRTELDGCLPVAKETLSPMIVSNISASKIPVGSSLINGLAALKELM